MKRHGRWIAAVCLVLACALAAGCTPVTGPDMTTLPTTSVPTTPPTTTAPVNVEFPLEEEVTLVLTARANVDGEELTKGLSANVLWQELYERTNVRVLIQDCEDAETLTSMLNADRAGDIVFCDFLKENDLTALVGRGKLLDLTEYVNNRDLMPNLNSRVFDPLPEAKGACTFADGKIYTLGTYRAEKACAMEAACWINKTWVGAAGMTLDEVSTIEGLERFFAWVKANDANGNGDPDDELPYGCYQSGYGFIESMLGCWGIPTKDQANEGYSCLVDGKVQFIPLTDAWIDFMTTMADWNQKGYLYEDYLLGHDGGNKPLYEYWMNMYVRDNGEPERIAFWTNTGAPARNTGAKMPEGTEMCEYVSILPPKVEGYETCWYIAPGYMGTKGSVAVSADCKTPEIACAWIDLFYSLEVSERVMFSEPGSSARGEYDGVTSWYYSTSGYFTTVGTEDGRLYDLFRGVPVAFMEEEYPSYRLSGSASKERREQYRQYRDCFNEEVWPRPYMGNTLDEYNTLYKAVQKVISQYRSAWLSGEGDPETDRSRFEAELKSAGVERMMELAQQAYDVFLDAMKSS